MALFDKPDNTIFSRPY